MTQNMGFPAGHESNKPLFPIADAADAEVNQKLALLTSGDPLPHGFWSSVIADSTATKAFIALACYQSGERPRDLTMTDFFGYGRNMLGLLKEYGRLHAGKQRQTPTQSLDVLKQDSALALDTFPLNLDMLVERQSALLRGEVVRAGRPARFRYAQLLPETLWRALEVVCYQSGKKFEDLHTGDFTAAGSDGSNLLGAMERDPRPLDDLKKRFSDRAGDLNRAKIALRQLELLKKRKPFWKYQLPETVQRCITELCYAAGKLPIDLEAADFELVVPSLGERQLMKGYLIHRYKEEGCGEAQAVEHLKEDPILGLASMPIDRPRIVQRQLERIRDEKFFQGWDSLLPETQFALLELLCYETGRLPETLYYRALAKTTIPSLGKTLGGWVNSLHRNGVAYPDAVQHIVKGVAQSGLRMRSLDRHCIMRKQLDEFRAKSRNFDWDHALPETIRECYRLMCKAANVLPRYAATPAFSAHIPELGRKTLTGLLQWYHRKGAYGNQRSAVKAMKADSALGIADLQERHLQERKTERLVEKIAKYQHLEWNHELVVQPEELQSLRRAAKRSSSYRRYQGEPDLQLTGWGKGVSRTLFSAWQQRGDTTARDRLLRRYFRMVSDRALQFVGQGVPYTQLVEFGQAALPDILNSYDPDGKVSLPLFMVHKIPNFLSSAIYGARLAKHAGPHQCGRPRENVHLDFLSACRDALLANAQQLAGEAASAPPYDPHLVLGDLERKALQWDARQSETYRRNTLPRYFRVLGGGRLSLGDLLPREQRAGEALPALIAERALDYVGYGVSYEDLVDHVLRNPPKASDQYTIITAIRDAILSAHRVHSHGQITALAETISDAISEIHSTGFGQLAEHAVDRTQRILSTIPAEHEFVLRARYGLGDSRYGLCFGRMYMLKEVAQMEHSGRTQTREGVRLKEIRAWELFAQYAVTDPPLPIVRKPPAPIAGEPPAPIAGEPPATPQHLPQWGAALADLLGQQAFGLHTQNKLAAYLGIFESQVSYLMRGVVQKVHEHTRQKLNGKFPASLVEQYHLPVTPKSD